MSTHHPARHCFTTIDFTNAPTVIVGDFTEGETYHYDFSAYPALLSAWQANPTGSFFNVAIRHSAVPFQRQP